MSGVSADLVAAFFLAVDLFGAKASILARREAQARQVVELRRLSILLGGGRFGHPPSVAIHKSMAHGRGRRLTEGG